MRRRGHSRRRQRRKSTSIDTTIWRNPILRARGEFAPFVARDTESSDSYACLASFACLFRCITHNISCLCRSFQLRTAFLLAIDYANESPAVLGGDESPLRLHGVAGDSRLDHDSTISATQALHDADCRIIVGPALSSTAVGASSLCTALQLPIISFSATTTALSNRFLAPYFARTMPSDVWQGQALAHLSSHMRFFRAALFYGDDAYGTSIAAAYRTAVATDVELVLEYRVTDAWEAEDWRSSIQAIMDRDDTRTVLLFTFSEAADAFYEAAVELGVNTQLVVLMSEAALSVTPSEDGSPVPQMGALGTNPAVGRGEAYEDMRTMWASRTSTDEQAVLWDNGDGVPPGFAGFVWDAVVASAMALRHAVEVAAAEGSGASVEEVVANGDRVYDALLSIRFNSTNTPTGMFFSTTGDPPAAYDVVNILANGTFAAVGGWTVDESAVDAVDDSGVITVAQTCARAADAADGGGFGDGDASREESEQIRFLGHLDLDEAAIVWPNGGSDSVPYARRIFSAGLVSAPAQVLSSPWTRMSVTALKVVADQTPGFFYSIGPRGETFGAVVEDIEAFHEANYDVVIAPSFSAVDAIRSIMSVRFPTLRFIAVDGFVGRPNVHSIVFAEQEGSFLAGIVAGTMTESKKVGVFAGPPFPPIKRWSHGFKAGVKHACPTCETFIHWQPDFSPGYNPFFDYEAGRTFAQNAFDAGADVMFGAAGDSGSAGLVKAAELGMWVIGVDVDEYITTFNNGAVVNSHLLLTSVMKSIDVPIEAALRAALSDEGRIDGPVYGSEVVDGLASGALKLAPCHAACEVMGSSGANAAVSRAMAAIVSGELTVPVVQSTGNEYIRAEDCAVGERFLPNDANPALAHCEPCPVDFVGLPEDVGTCRLCPEGATVAVAGKSKPSLAGGAVQARASGASTLRR